MNLCSDPGFTISIENFDYLFQTNLKQKLYIILNIFKIILEVMHIKNRSEYIRIYER